MRVQVFFATLSGMFVFKKGGYISIPLVAYMGSTIILGSFIGGYGSKFLSNGTINLVYAILALLAAILMLFPKPAVDGETVANEVEFNRFYAIFFALIVGVASGIVGAAGAFIIVPIMLVILKIPTRIAIGSSLSNYLHIINWSNRREGFWWTYVASSFSGHGCFQPNCSTNWCPPQQKNEHQILRKNPFCHYPRNRHQNLV